MSAADGSEREESPSAVIVAGSGGIEDIHIAAAPDPDLAVLADVANARVLLGPPSVLRSTFTRLMFLDGRYGQLFEKFDERVGYGSERVTTWRVRWPE
jgi:hypothetical protein